MNIGGRLYIAHDTGIDSYIIDSIEHGTVKIHYDSDDMEIKSQFSLEDFESGKSPNLFDDYNKALVRSKVLKQEAEARKQKYFEKILDEALNSVTLTEVEKHGTLLKSKRKYDKDNRTVAYHEALLYEFEGKKYAIIYKYPYNSHKECVMFGEL